MEYSNQSERKRTLTKAILLMAVSGLFFGFIGFGIKESKTLSAHLTYQQYRTNTNKSVQLYEDQMHLVDYLKQINVLNERSDSIHQIIEGLGTVHMSRFIDLSGDLRMVETDIHSLYSRNINQEVAPHMRQLINHLYKNREAKRQFYKQKKECSQSLAICKVANGSGGSDCYLERERIEQIDTTIRNFANDLINRDFCNLGIGLMSCKVALAKELIQVLE